MTNWFAKDKQSATEDAITDILTGNTESMVTPDDETIEEHLDVSKYDLIAWDYVTADFK